MTSSQDIVQYVLGLKGNDGAVVIALLWTWWDARNKANAEKRMPTIEEVQYRTLEAASNSNLVQRMVSRDSPRQQQSPCRWHPPPANFLKINIDGAFCEKEKKGAWGFVIRDCDGHGVLAGSGNLLAVNDALSAEAEACLAALNAAMDAGISQVIVETDSTSLVAALQSPSFDQAPGGVIFREARRLLALHFTVHGICFVRRTCNRYAHELARSGLARDPDAPIIWSDPLPSFVNTLGDRDLADPSSVE
jgi:hypothetical protein